MDADVCVQFIVRIREQEEYQRMNEGAGRSALQSNHEIEDEENEVEDVNGGGLHCVNRTGGDLHNRVEKGRGKGSVVKQRPLGE